MQQRKSIKLQAHTMLRRKNISFEQRIRITEQTYKAMPIRYEWKLLIGRLTFLKF